jgi:hypothetical protein
MAHDEHERNSNESTGYEVEDASVREVVLTGVGLAVGTIIVCVAVFGLFRVLSSQEVKARRPITEVSAPPRQPPAPHLEEKPWEELEALRAKEEQTLSTYGWVNRETNAVRIPVERAMQIIAQRGLPVRRTGAERAAEGGLTSGQQR